MLGEHAFFTTDLQDEIALENKVRARRRNAAGLINERRAYGNKKASP